MILELLCKGKIAAMMVFHAGYLHNYSHFARGHYYFHYCFQNYCLLRSLHIDSTVDKKDIKKFYD